MPDWLKMELTGSETPVATLALRLLLAWVGGYFVAVIAQRRRDPLERGSLTLTLVLMSILIAMATQIIGNNVARAFSLVGALSIVRFRTAVPESRDVAFVLAAVVVGMAVGAGQYWVASLGLVVVALASLFEAKRPAQKEVAGAEIASPNGLRLMLQVGLNASNVWTQEFDQINSKYELVSAETARRGSALELVYRLHLQPATDAVALLARLNTLPGVESVSLKSFAV
jgi:uncharacterized membrane protein YhiD involved in acid resistance